LPRGNSARTPPPCLDKTFADFFAGIGLMRLGLQRRGWSILFANDIDERKLEMYKGNFPDAEHHYILRDIHQLSSTEVPRVCLATASFPCNDLSLAGARDGLGGKHSSAFWGFIRILKQMDARRPPLVLLENVTGFLTSRWGKDFQDALLALNGLGYAVDTFALDAASFVPQSRPRLFVVGILGRAKTRKAADAPPTPPTEARPPALAQFICEHPDIAWRLSALPAPPRNHSGTLVDVLEDLPEGAPEWWSKERVEYLLNQMSPRHRRTAEHMMQSPERSFGTVFRRVRTIKSENKFAKKSMAELRTDGIAGCLRTPRGGSGRQILLTTAHGKFHARLLTPRECARLMGAGGYKITVSPNQALFGFGDAVCVPVVEWIARHCLNPLLHELVHGRAALRCA
jgi:DNA (cytosine-5)-methyltransferase 1